MVIDTSVMGDKISVEKLLSFQNAIHSGDNVRKDYWSQLHQVYYRLIFTNIRKH
jgi:hypothetical protein